MNRQAETAPLHSSFVLSTQFPCPPPSVNRGSCMPPPPRRSSLPPRPPKVPTTTRQQMELQSFNPGPRLPHPQSPVFASSTPMSPAPFRDFQPAPVAYHNGGFPPLPTTSVGGHTRAYDSGLHPMVHGEKGSDGEPASFMDEYVTAYMNLDKNFDFSSKNDDVDRISGGSSENNWRNAATTNSDVKKRAVPSRRRKSTFSSSVDCNNLNNIGTGKMVFTESQMNEIARSEKLKKMLVTDPKNVRRILLNREAARRTHERRAQHHLKLQETIRTLEKENATVTAEISSAEKTYLGLEEKNKQLRIRVQEMEEQEKRANALTECYNGEISRLKQKGTGEVIPNKEMTMDESMTFEQLNRYFLYDGEMETKNYNLGFE